MNWKRLLWKNPREYSLGLRSYQKKEWSIAESRFSKSIQKHPLHAPSHFKLGMCYFKQKDFSTAIWRFKKAIEISPSSTQWYKQLEQAIDSFQIQEGLSENELEVLLRETIKSLNSPSVNIYKKLASCLRLQGRWHDEINVREKVCEDNEAAGEDFYELAQTYEATQRWRDALIAYDKALPLIASRNHFFIFYKMGVCSENLHGAEPNVYYLKALALKDCPHGVGEVHEGYGHYHLALKEYRNKLELTPNNAELHFRLARVSHKCNFISAAKFHCQTAISLDLERSEYHFFLGKLHEEEKSWENAYDAYFCAIKLRGTYTPYWQYCLGTALYKAGKYRDSCDAFFYGSEKYEHEESEATTYELLQSQASVDRIKKVISDGLYDSDLLAKLAYAYSKLKDWNSAALAFKEAASLTSPLNTELYYDAAYYLFRAESYKASSELCQIHVPLIGFRKRIAKEIEISLIQLSYDGMGKYSFQVKIKNHSKKNTVYDLIGLVFKHRPRIGNEHLEFFLQPDILLKGFDSIYFNTSFEVDQYELPLHYWDMFVDIRVSDRVYGDVVCRLSIRKYSKHILANVDDFPYQYAYTDQSTIIFPYKTVGGKKIAFLKRPKVKYDNDVYVERERQALAEYSANKEELDAHKAWLIFEKYSNTAQDNSYYFFKYAAAKRNNVYFVIDPESPDRPNLSGYENNIVEFMSVQHMKLLLSCEMLISSEARGHGYAWRRIHGDFKNALLNKPYVFLQHGVISLKRLGDTFHKANKNFSADFFVCSTKKEQNIISNWFGYSESELILSGLPRWLGFENEVSNENIVFIMPTWRNWLEDVTEEQFTESNYFKEYRDLLSSKELKQMALEYNCQFKFLIHPKVSHYLEKFSLEEEHVSAVDTGSVSIREMLSRSSLLITDYSSVAWDFVFLSKPVIFYQFDVYEYKHLQGSYIDMPDELPGVVAYGKEELMSVIKKHLLNYKYYQKKAEEVSGGLFFDKSVDPSAIIYGSIVSGSKS